MRARYRKKGVKVDPWVSDLSNLMYAGCHELKFSRLPAWICGIPNAQCDGIWRWDLWEYLVHEGGVGLAVEISALIRELSSPLCSLPHEDTARREPSAIQEEGSQELNLPAP